MVSTSRPSRLDDDLDARSVAMHSDPRFIELKRRLRVFIVPTSVAFMAWYLLYVVMSVYARDIMEIVLVGSVNVALIFGALQFASTFGIALLYSWYSSWRLDPLADELNAELVRPGRGDGGQS